MLRKEVSDRYEMEVTKFESIYNEVNSTEISMKYLGQFSNKLDVLGSCTTYGIGFKHCVVHSIICVTL